MPADPVPWPQWREGGGSMRLWGGRFESTTDERVADFTRSVDLDRALAADDIAGSIAHVHGLGRAGLLANDEVAVLVAGLHGLRAEVVAGTIEWDPALEDVHMNLESALQARIGPLAGRLHTGRSRNDQVATDLRLWLRRTVDVLDDAIVGMERALVRLADREGDAILPGTTHIQPAQPVLLAHHLLAYVEMLERDRGRLAEEITWWSNPRFGFVRAADAFSTGSSMMPNKKNPDPAELVRGRTAGVIGSLTGMLALLKGLPLAYQRDLQEDKAPLFEAAATLEASLGVMAGMVSTLTVDRERMRIAAGEGYITATAVADALVRRGVDFRAAHHIVGTLVVQAERALIGLEALGDATIAAAVATSDDSVAVTW